MDRDETDSSENDSGDELDEPGPPVNCLFCSVISETMSQSIDHIKKEHSFNIEKYLSENVVSTYDLIKIITYIRTKKISPSELEAPGRPWDFEEYLKPIDSSDPWLWTDFEFIEDSDIEPKYVNSENGVITLSKEDFDELQKRNQELVKLVEEKDRQMEKLRNLLNKETDDHKQQETSRDLSYFDSYSSLEIHREMLSDVPRMEAFKGLFNDVSLFKDKRVLDVGCGTGILSLMAASAGAAKVVGVDDSDIFYSALEIIHVNGFDSTINLIKGKIEDVQLDDKFDVIVSEWMGYFLLFEGMLSSVLTARDRFLNPGGHIFPSACTIWLAGVSDLASREARLMSEVYGFKMTPLRRVALSEASIETVKPQAVATQSVCVYNVNLLTAQKEDCYFSSDFKLSITRDCELTGVCGWFDSSFEPSQSLLTTSPSSPPTHWQQAVFYLEKTIPSSQGDSIEGRISVEPASGEGFSRSLIVRLTLRGIEQTFNVV